MQDLTTLADFIESPWPGNLPLKFTKASVYIPGQDTKTVSAYKLNELATSSSLQVLKQVAAEKIRAFANKTADDSTSETCTDSIMTSAVKIAPNIVGPTMSISFNPMICELDDENEQAVCSPSTLVMKSTPTVLTWARTKPATYTEQTCADTTLIGVSASLTIGGNDRNVSLSAWKTVFDLHPESVSPSSPSSPASEAPAPAPSASRIDCDELNATDTTVSVANLQPVETDDGLVVPTYYYTTSPSPSPSPDPVTASAEMIVASVPSGSNVVTTGLGSPSPAATVATTQASPAAVSSPSPTTSLYSIVSEEAPTLGAGPISSSVSTASVSPSPVATTTTEVASVPATATVPSTTTSSPAIADDTTVSVASDTASPSLASPAVTTASPSSSSPSLASTMDNVYTTTATQAQESAASLLSWMRSQGLMSPSPAADAAVELASADEADAPVPAPEEEDALLEDAAAPAPEAEAEVVATAAAVPAAEVSAPKAEPKAIYDAAAVEGPATEEDDMTDDEYDSLDTEGLR